MTGGGRSAVRAWPEARLSCCSGRRIISSGVRRTPDVASRYDSSASFLVTAGSSTLPLHTCGARQAAAGIGGIAAGTNAQATQRAP